MFKKLIVEGWIRDSVEMTLLMAIIVVSSIYVFKFSDLITVTLYWFNEIGPTSVLLWPMAIILTAEMLLLSLGRLDEQFPSKKELLIIEKYAPLLGLLGTVLGLIGSLRDFDFSLETQRMIRNVIVGLMQALGSTAVGIILSAIAGGIYDWLESKEGIHDQRSVSTQAQEDDLKYLSINDCVRSDGNPWAFQEESL